LCDNPHHGEEFPAYSILRVKWNNDDDDDDDDAMLINVRAKAGS